MNKDKKPRIEIICTQPWFCQNGEISLKCPIKLSSIKPVIIAKTHETNPNNITHHDTIKSSVLLNKMEIKSNKTADENNAIGKCINSGCHSTSMFS